MWKTAGLLLFHVCVGVIHHSLPKARLFFIAGAFPAQVFHCFKTQSGAGALSCGAGWPRAGFRCPPGDWGCQIGWSGDIRAKLKTATPPVINHLHVASVLANPTKPQATDSSEGTMPDIQKNELNPQHVRADQSIMSPTRKHERLLFKWHERYCKCASI